MCLLFEAWWACGDGLWSWPSGHVLRAPANVRRRRPIPAGASHAPGPWARCSSGAGAPCFGSIAHASRWARSAGGRASRARVQCSARSLACVGPRLVAPAQRGGLAWLLLHPRVRARTTCGELVVRLLRRASAELRESVHATRWGSSWRYHATNWCREWCVNAAQTRGHRAGRSPPSYTRRRLSHARASVSVCLVHVPLLETEHVVAPWGQITSGPQNLFPGKLFRPDSTSFSFVSDVAFDLRWPRQWKSHERMSAVVEMFSRGDYVQDGPPPTQHSKIFLPTNTQICFVMPRRPRLWGLNLSCGWLVFGAPPGSFHNPLGV